MVQRVLTRLRFSRLLTPYLTSFLLMTGLAIGLFYLWFSIHVEAQLRQEIRESAQAQTQKAAFSFENGLSDLDALSSKLSNLGALTPSAFEHDPIQAFQALAHYNSTLRYDDLAIVYSGSATLLSAFGTCDAALYFAHIPEAGALISDIHGCTGASLLSTARYGAAPEQAQLLYVQPLPMTAQTARYHAVYLLDPATTNDRLFSGGDLTTQRFLYAADGALIWSHTPAFAPSGAYMDTRQPLAHGQLILRERVEIGEPLDKLDSARKTLALFCALMILFGCLLAFWSARRGYRPLQRLLSNYWPRESPPAGSDIEALGRIFQRHQDFLRQRTAPGARLSPEFIQEMLALSLAHGHIQESEYLSELEGGVLSPFETGYGFVCLLRFDQRPGSATLTALRQAMQRTGVYGLCAAAEIEPLILCVFRSSAPDPAARAGICKKLMSAAGLRATCACGAAYPSLHHLSQSYREAEAALESRGCMGCHTVILYDALAPQARESALPGELLEAYGQALREGHFEPALSRLSGLCQQCKRQRPNMQVCLWLCFELISRSESGLLALFDGNLPRSLKPFIGALDRAMSIPELSGRLSRLLKAAQQEWARLTLQRDEEFLALCLDVLRENIGNADFSVESIAERANITLQSLRRRFKLLTGSTLIGKLTELRLEEAKRLLGATQLEVAEITRRVGYLDSSNFSRLFKKAVGVSPSQFRAARDASFYSQA